MGKQMVYGLLYLGSCPRLKPPEQEIKVKNTSGAVITVNQ
jgi:hypothetical protein